jgi:glycosyltransferase involved in cell wall biosynthesis
MNRLTEPQNSVTSSPTVSIGMPVYNGEKYVGEAIQSHLIQTYSDFELILTDNASTDHTEEICRSYAAKDPRVKYHRNPQNLGVAGNFRRGFDLSVGRYFRWSPSDDLVSPNLLQSAVDILDRDPSIFVAYAQTKLIDDKGDITGDFDENLHLVDDSPVERWKALHRNLRMGNLPYGLCRSSTLRKTGLLRNYSGGDFPLIAEMSLYGKFFEIPDAFFYRRMHEQASSAMKNAADVMALYDPKKRGKLFLYNWVHLGANLKSIVRAPLPFPQKVRLFGFEARWVFWGRREYLRELTMAARHVARKLRP